MGWVMQVPGHGDDLCSGRIQTSGVCLHSLRFYPFPRAKPLDELLLLWPGYPPLATSLGMPGMIRGRASTTAGTAALSTASAKPAPHFVHLQTWLSLGWRCGKAKQCHKHCKASRNTGGGHKLPSKATFSSSDQVFHSKTKQAVPPGCFLQAPHFALLLGSHPTNQNSLEGETPPQSPPGVPGRPAPGGSASPLHRGSHHTEGHAEPQWGKVLTAPWGGTHISGGVLLQAGLLLGFARGDGPCLQPTSTAERMQPTEPPTEQHPHPRVKKWEENQPHP